MSELSDQRLHLRQPCNSWRLARALGHRLRWHLCPFGESLNRARDLSYRCPVGCLIPSLSRKY